MGVTYYLALKGPGAEAASERDLGFLAKAAEQLDLLCELLQVTPVSAYASRSRSDGLRTFQMVLEALMSNDDPLPRLPRRSTDWLSEEVLQAQVRRLGFPPETAAATRELMSRPLGLRPEQLPRLLEELEYVVSWLAEHPDARFRLVPLS